MPRIRTQLTHAFVESTYVDEVGDTMTGPLTIDLDNDAENGLVVQRNSATHSGKLIDVQSQAGGSLASVDKDGLWTWAGAQTAPDHGLDSATEHTASGLSVGQVLRASGATTFAWAQLGHADLGTVTADQHHTEDHQARHLSGGADALTGTVDLGTAGILRLSADAQWSRPAASRLQSNAHVETTLDTWARRGAADEIKMGQAGPASESGFRLGGDTYLYRVGTSSMRVSGKWAVDGELEVDGALNHDGTTVGFYGATPVARPAAYTQTYATATRTHAARATTSLLSNGILLPQDWGIDDLPALQSAPTGLVAGERDVIRSNFSDIAEQMNDLKADIENTAQVLNSLIDDLQANGTLQ